MAEHAAAPQIENAAGCSAFTGDDSRNEHLVNALADSIRRASSIDIIVSFLMESGVRSVVTELAAAAARNVKIRILTGSYLGITQPSALYLLKSEITQNLDLRFYNDPHRSFHPKCYIFSFAGGGREIYVGSSNISRSALTSGIEWNYRFTENTDPSACRKFCSVFEELFLNHSLILDDALLERYARSWHRPEACRMLELYDDDASPRKSDARTQADQETVRFIPRGAQIEALYALKNARAEGAQKCLVVAATGVGKTALAAFDSLSFKKILFVVHRREILRQAARTFADVRGTRSIGFFDADSKNTEAEVTLASVATLGSGRYLSEKYFSRDLFDYIIMDEIHHGTAGQYRRIMDYFTPGFMLGLTATPERLDQKSVFELFDYNVPYEINLAESVNRGFLAPFRYYGIYDRFTDYSTVNIIKGKFSTADLTRAYRNNEERNSFILSHYRKTGSRRALGFCCSREHAEQMAGVFCNAGINAVAVYSNAAGEFSEDRDRAIAMLEQEQIKVIFSVDMFNEGVDIAPVDLVMFLRPTESPVIFLQQLGRGLRLHPDKSYLNVLDFIGNYQKAGRIRNFLKSGCSSTSSGEPFAAFSDGSGSSVTLPDRCQVDFDIRLLDLFAVQDRQRRKAEELIFSEYQRIRELLGHRPLRTELFELMEPEIYQLTLGSSKNNIFKHYLAFLHKHGELTAEEHHLTGSIAADFLTMAENTAMTKVYKMPVLKAFIRPDGLIATSVSAERLLEVWKKFFSESFNWRDLEPDLTLKKFSEISDSRHLEKIYHMPVKFLTRTESSFFSVDESSVLHLAPQLAQFTADSAFAAHYRDIISYRCADYYRRRYEGKKITAQSSPVHLQKEPVPE